MNVVVIDIGGFLLWSNRAVSVFLHASHRRFEKGLIDIWKVECAMELIDVTLE